MPNPLRPIQDIDRTIGANLRRIRKKRGLTLATLGRRIGVTEAMVSMVERGRTRIRVDTLAAAAKALGVKPGVFFADAQVVR